MSYRVGFHGSVSGGYHCAINQGDAFGCEVLQIFTKNNLRWDAKPFTKTELEAYHSARKNSAISLVFGHSGYLINLAATNPQTLQKSRESLLLELDRSAQLGLPFLVLHPGAAKERTVRDGLSMIIESLEWVFARTDSPTRVALEATAGAGTVLGSKIEELATLINETPSSSRLAVCLDTCHLFASGYDLRTAADVHGFVKAFKQQIDWTRVVCLHMNDSVGGLGSHLDRHAILGEGQIGWECFQTIINSPDFADIPLCLETPPGVDRINDARTLAKLKTLRSKSA